MQVPLLHYLANQLGVAEARLDVPYEQMVLSSKNLYSRAVKYEVKWTPGPHSSKCDDKSGCHVHTDECLKEKCQEDCLVRPEPQDGHPVKRFHSSFARHLVARAPARTSKSKSAAMECGHDGIPVIDTDSKRPVQDERIVWMVGTDYNTLKEWEYVWGDLVPDDFRLIRELGGRVTQKANAAGSGNLKIIVEWGKAVSGRIARTVWVGKSSQNEVSLQGEEVTTASLSEAAEHEERVVTKYLWPRCGRILYPTTPKRKAGWIHKMIQDGVADEIVYTRECNPVYDWQRYIDGKKAALATHGDLTKALDWLEQFEGEWVFAEGMVLPFRWLSSPGLPSHVVDESDTRWREIADWLRFAEWNVSMDYGYTDSACAHLWAVGTEGQKLLYGEVYERHLSNPAFIDRMRRVFGKLIPAGRSVREWIPDPQKPELTRLLSEAGLKVWGGLSPKLHRDRTASFRALIDALSTDERTGQIPLLVHSRCTQTIREWKHLRKKDKWAGEEFAKGAMEGDQHAADSGRYGAIALRHRKAQHDPMQWLERHQRSVRDRLDREYGYREWAGMREARI